MSGKMPFIGCCEHSVSDKLLMLYEHYNCQLLSIVNNTWFWFLSMHQAQTMEHLGNEVVEEVSRASF
jgi:hypothetical protein